MKPLYAILLLFIFAVSCKSDKSETLTEVKKELTIAEKIANAHGFENWKNVTEVQFTFAVDRDTIKGSGRSWSWLPKKDSVSMTAGEQNFKYSRLNIDSQSLNADRAFINDKYWLLVPFQLVWDNTATISEPAKAQTPISKTDMDMITILYPSEGGYTPGDAYDIYYDKDYMIREWTFRKGNSETPSLSTTFENYQDYNGIKIATDHKQEDGKWNLNFANVKVKTEIKVF
ncbi:hypothetical protein [uncultured Winogradskyella sp.]|uniref:hypothetical protein n=1 Tax=uncultured Winogradskyella sp. TaxID=395353 RepID=UPI00262D1423|nr:hypothetical protein [uncultured Winogradskyella sp.]